MNVWGYTEMLPNIVALMPFCTLLTHLDRKISNRQLEIDNYKIIRRNRDANTMAVDVYSTSPMIYAEHG